MVIWRQFMLESNSQYSTQDCKIFIVQHYPRTNIKNWKRKNKYKNEKGEFVREFIHVDLQVTIIETKDGLKIENMNENNQQSFDSKIDYTVYLNKDIMDNELLLTSIQNKTPRYIGNDHYEHFKHILNHGIIMQDAMPQTALMLSKKIDFQEKVLLDQYLLDKVIHYTAHQLIHFYELDEEYMTHHCSQDNFFDSLPDMIHIIKMVKSAYEQNKMPLVVNKKTVNDCLNAMSEINDMMDGEPKLMRKSKQKMQELKSLLKELYHIEPSNQAKNNTKNKIF